MLAACVFLCCCILLHIPTTVKDVSVVTVRWAATSATVCIAASTASGDSPEQGACDVPFRRNASQFFSGTCWGRQVQLRGSFRDETNHKNAKETVEHGHWDLVSGSHKRNPTARTSTSPSTCETGLAVGPLLAIIFFRSSTQGHGIVR